jgi:hypothetical protein
MAIYNQQINNRLDVYVHADATPQATSSESSQVDPNAKNEEESREKVNRRKLAKSLHFTRTAINVATRQVPNFVIGQFGMMTGDSNYQAMSQRRVEQVQDTLGSALNIGASAILLGPVGAVISAVGVATSLISKYEQRNMQTAMDVWKQEQSVNYNNASSGIDITDGRTRLR